jgi:hypothetical protein
MERYAVLLSPAHSFVPGLAKVHPLATRLSGSLLLPTRPLTHSYYQLGYLRFGKW